MLSNVLRHGIIESPPNEQSFLDEESYLNFNEVNCALNSGDFSSSSYTTEFVSGSRIRTSGWLTSGNSTERSSVYSWGEDEFDKEASKNVAKMFEDIDAVLFEASRTNNAVLKTECKDWVERFPHIRIIGTQIFEPTDTGCRFYPTSSEEFDSRPSTSSTLIETDALLLSVTGYSVKVLSSVPSPDTIDEPPLEEVFFSDGVVEEVLAFDSQQQSTEIQTNSSSYYLPQRRRKGYPPITPFACVRDTSYAALFVRLWADILKWCSGYWHQQWHEIHPSSDIPSLQPQSRTTPYEHEFARSMQGSVSQQRLGTASSMASHNINGLNQLLSIGPKKITMRQPSNNLEDNPFPQSSTSSLLKSSRQQSRYPPLRSSVVRLQPLSRGTNGKKFAMLGGSYPPGGALQEEDLSREMVVRRLVPSTGNEQFSPPPYRSAHVSGVILPPIESGRPSRAFSAKVDDKFLMKPTRILIGGHFSTSFKENYDSRPSTTIDFRDEYGYPLRKLSNPRANIPQELSYGVVGIPMALNAREDSTLSEEHLRGDSNEPWVDAPRPGSRPPRGKLGTAR